MTAAGASIGESQGRDITIDVAKLIGSRMLVQANSGAGKSWALRKILEATHAQVQQIVIDTEGEFSTLREKFPYVLAAARGGDCLASVKTAKLLARRIMELRTSIIIDISEMKAQERIFFVRDFLTALLALPQSLRGKALVVLDEAQIYCSEKGSRESSDAVIDLMTRGRKRGLCGVLATQRLSELRKAAAAETNNKILGRAALDIDTRRTGDELGFNKEKQRGLRTLKAGQFFAFGPAISDTVIEIQIGPVETTHPEPGQTTVPPTAPSPKIMAALSKLADLPAEAEQQEETTIALQREVRSLRGKLAQRPKPEADEAALNRAFERGVASAAKEIADLERDRKALEIASLGFANIVADKAVNFRALVIDALAPDDQGRTAKIGEPPEKPSRIFAAPELRTDRTPLDPIKVKTSPGTSDRDLTGPERRVLDALAWWESTGITTQPTKGQVAFKASYSPGGGSFNNTLGSLRGLGAIERLGEGRLTLTDAGRECARYPDTTPTTESLHECVLGILKGPERKLLTQLLNAHPSAMSKDELAAATDYAPNGGSFNNTRGRLRTLGLIEYVGGPGMARACDCLFLERAA